LAKAHETSSRKPISSRKSQPAWSRALLFAVAFIGGWTIMMLEILGGRVLAPFFGYSVYQWGALIGVVMAALALGYYLGGRIGDRPGARNFLLVALIASTVFIVVVPRLADAFMPAARVAGPAWGAVIGSAILLGVPSILLATTSPIVIRLTATSLIANSAGLVYAVSTVGSIGGTFFTAFYAIPELGTRFSHYVAGALLVIAALALAAVGRHYRAAVVAVVMLAAGYPFAPQARPGEIYRAESIHNIIIVTDNPQTRDLYLNYSLGPQTVMAKHALLTGSYYDFYLLGPHINGAKKVLFLGVAGGTALKQLVETYPDVTVDGIDLDPAVIKVAQTYFGLDKLPRIHLMADDARWYLANTKKRYDLIAIDLYVTGHIPFFTTTREFFKLVRDRLTDNGIVIMNVLSLSGSGELVAPLVRTIRTAFPSTFMVSQGNFMVIATKQTTSFAKLREIFAKPGATPDVDNVLSRARGSLRPVSVGSEWPIFTDDLNDVEFRTFRTFFGG
jgi:predicted membrane-bound spermidine synthase